MAKGKTKVHLVHTKGVEVSDVPSWDFLYTASSVRDDRFHLSDRVALPDGRVFRYAKCGYKNIATNKYGVKNGAILIANRVAGTSLVAVTLPSAVVGATEVTVTFTAATLGDSACNTTTERDGVIPKDDLRGGYISFYTGDYRQQRGIIGNTAIVATDTSMTLYLDAALDHVLTSGTSVCEILGNPYANVYRDNGQYISVMGMPNVTAVDGQYLWLQTWGPLRISGTASLGATSRQRQYVFDDQGAVVAAHDTVTATTDYDQQHAGFVIERSDGIANCEAPFIMLQISP